MVRRTGFVVALLLASGGPYRCAGLGRGRRPLQVARADLRRDALGRALEQLLHSDRDARRAR